MAEFTYKERTKRNLPHLHSPETTLFVTFRLAGTVPQPVLRHYRARKKWLEDETKRILSLKLNDDSPEMESHEKRLRDFRRLWFMKFEGILHQAATGPTWLKQEEIAKIVADAIHHRDGNVYRLDAYCIMSNHVHTVFAPFLSFVDLSEILLPTGLRFISKNPPLNVIMKSLKGYTAWAANRSLGRKGKFWEAESYDHMVRTETEFHRIVTYVLQNPVKAGLVKDWQDWKWSYCRNPVPQAV